MVNELNSLRTTDLQNITTLSSNLQNLEQNMSKLDSKVLFYLFSLFLSLSLFFSLDSLTRRWKELRATRLGV